jgi:hypothetical protein
MGRAIQVHFINANSGQTIGRTELSLEQLPPSFETETTLQIGQTNWVVERAEPPTAPEFAQTGQLELLLREVTMLPAKDILYSLPTICDELPGLDSELDRSRCFVLREDDWRQVEFVTPDQLGTVDDQCAAIRRIYAEHAHEAGDMTAFDAIHVRSAPVRPIGERLLLPQLTALLPAVVRHYTGVSFQGATGAVPNSFAMGFDDCVLYGLSTSDGVRVLAMHGKETRPAQPLRSLGLSLVDWVSCTVS